MTTQVWVCAGRRMFNPEKENLMFHHSSKLQYTVKVDKPDPVFACHLQQAIGGIEGEIRVAMQYFFQAMGCRGDPKYRDLLMMIRWSV